MSKLLTKIKNNKTEFLLLIAILALASFLRFYHLNDFLHFANDEGRDAFVIKEMVEEGIIPLLGPEVSIGHFHLGPIFYYFLFPFFWFGNNQPVSGAIMTALFGIASVYLLWRLTKKFLSKEAGLFAAFLYTTSFVVILHSRWSWNLNLLPFFLLVYLYSFWKIIILKKEKKKWFYLWILSLGIILQLHASAFLFLPITLILLLVYRPKNLSWKNYMVGGFILLILFAPFLIYELIYDFENYHKMTKMLSEEVSTQAISKTILGNVINFVEFANAIVFVNFSGLDLNLLFKNLDVARFSALPGVLLILSLFLFTICYAFKNEKNQGFQFMALVTLLLLIGFLIFRKILYLHYYIIYFPLIFFFLSGVLAFMYQRIFWGKILALGFIFIISLFNIFYLVNYWSSLSSGSWQKSNDLPFFQMEKAINWIAYQTKNNEINLKCQIKGYCRAFQYLLELKNIKIDSNASDSFRIYKISNLNSRFGPIEVEKIN